MGLDSFALEGLETDEVARWVLWLSLLLCILFFVQVVIIDWYLERKNCKIPGPRSWPIFYNLIELYWTKDRAYDVLLDRVLKYGKTVTIRVPGVLRIVTVVEPECVDYILNKNFNNYVKGPETQAMLKDFLGDGIFNTNGANWKRQRQIASHLFSTKEIKNMSVVFLKHGDHLISKLENLPDGQSIDIQDLFQRFTLDSVGEIAFGTNVDSLNKNVPFAKAFDMATANTDARFLMPLWNWKFSQYWLPSEIRLKKALAVINQFAEELIDEHLRNPDLSAKTDLLSRYMSQTDVDGKPFSRKYLRDVIMNFMIAGRDTTAQTLTWTFYLLSQNPEKEALLLQEIDRVLENGKILPNFENIKSMPYLKGVVEETLRLYPPVPIDPKSAVADDVLPNGTIIKKGYSVEWSAWVLGRHPDFWDCPSEFRPERWIYGLEQNGGKPVSYHVPPYIPFQYGPRLCLGQQMAYVEVKIALCLILQKFQLVLVEGQHVTYKPTITISAKNGMWMKVKKRENKCQ